MRKRVSLLICGILLVCNTKILDASSLNTVSFVNFNNIGNFFEDLTSNLVDFFTASVKDDGTSLEKKNSTPSVSSSEKTEVDDLVTSVDYSNNKLIETDFCDVSGNREKNVYTDIGFDYKNNIRNYYGYTNEYAQLSYVYAEELILQDDDIEPVIEGRYCSDEAKVEGVQSSDLDEGHAIADSLGGVGNAYNITPQNSYLNRNGTQSQMEEHLRNSLKNGSEITEFNYFIYYDDGKTQIPSSYEVNFLEDGKLMEYSFDNK